jgi:hypothetical protein
VLAVRVGELLALGDGAGVPVLLRVAVRDLEVLGDDVADSDRVDDADTEALGLQVAV